MSITLEPQSADPFRKLLLSAGYSDDLIRDNYPVWSASEVVVADIAAFGRPQPIDVTTATVVGQHLPRHEDRAGLFAIARSLACPAAIATVDHTIELWSIGARTETRVGTTPVEDAAGLGDRFRTALDPAWLLPAKTHGWQLPMFSVDVALLTTARSEQSHRLADLVTQAMTAALAGRTSKKSWERASRLVVRSLAALMVRDKFDIADESGDLWQTAQARFPRFFDDRADVDVSTNRDVVEILGSNVNYRGLDPRVMSDVYEAALLSEADRLRLGIVYTPASLARRIVDSIPFEELAPDDRNVLDPACGSGTLLLAAHDRLLGLLAPAIAEADGHEYAISHLEGWDKDSFAAEIAKLALFLHAGKDSWQIEERDGLRPLTPGKPRPSVVVCNPPWGEVRSREFGRRQIANLFVDRIMDLVRPNGFVALILPEGWLSTKASADARKRFAERTDIFEVWRLPEDTFASASMAPCVVIAQVRAPTGRPWLFRRVRDHRGLDAFYQRDAGDQPILGRKDAGLRPDSLLRGPLDHAAPELSRMPRLTSIARVVSGPTPKPPAAIRGGEGPYRWLRHAGDLPAFREAPPTALEKVRYPDDFHHAGATKVDVLSRPKVLVSAKHSTGGVWRLKSGLDLRGVIPRESLYMVVPHEVGLEPVYALTAFLGSRFASCWIDSYSATMAAASSLLRDMPVPAPGHDVWAVLADLGHELSIAVQVEVRDLAIRVDEAVERAMGLSGEVMNLLRQQYAGQVAPEGSVRYPGQILETGAESPSRGFDRFGAVLGVSGNRVRLWVPGLTEEEGEELEVPHRFKGWLSVPEATFNVAGQGRDLSGAAFTFQRSSYVEEPEATAQAFADSAV